MKPTLAALALTAVFALGVSRDAATQGYQLRVGTDGWQQQIEGPATPADAPAWLEAMKTWRISERVRINYDPSNYERPQLQWAQRNPIQPQVMIEDRYLYDPQRRRYTVDRYLDDVERRYGGVDSVLLWPTYPNIGIDNRNTVDMIRNLPGGTAGVRRLVDDFHRRSVRVLFPIMSWDEGTRHPGVASWADILPKVMKELGVDGLNGDVMNAVPALYFDASLIEEHPLVLEPELGLGSRGMPIPNAVGRYITDPRLQLGRNLQSWGYWNNDDDVPRVSINKWLEPRHTVHVNDRWTTSKISMLQTGFFNGSGLETWENIWGIWNGMTDRDEAATRRVAAIERQFAKLLVSSEWEPHTPTLQSRVYASKWPSETGTPTLWTIINRDPSPRSGAQLQVDYHPGTHYYDLWNGVELEPVVTSNRAVLSFQIEGQGFGAVLASALADLPDGFGEFQRTMRRLASRPLSSFSTANEVLPQAMTPIPATRKASSTPSGMVYVSGASYRFATSGVEIEGDNRPGVGVQFPWESRPSRQHDQTMTVTPLYIDRTPVTNRQFQSFMDATGYRPADRDAFLADWDWSSPRRPRYKPGWDDKPVTWVSIEDARAFARWAGRRLPHSWEWQYAAQGLDNRSYPWGGAFDAARVPLPFSGRGEMRPPDAVDAHPAGASPFGVLDMVGNVWQWTDEFTDEHTRTAVLRGGSYYRALGSRWYFPSDETAYRLDHQSKYLLLSPGRDRAATIGFRTVVDAAEPASRNIQ